LFNLSDVSRTRERLGVPVRTRDAAISSPAVEIHPSDPSGELQPSAPSDLPDQVGVVSTRASRTWLKVVPALLLLGAILMFVFENLRSTKVSFATASGTMPLAVALLAAAALGGLLVFTLGSIRIVQLRKLIHRVPQPQQS
jgi:uncharacterized integral membrane protein